MEASDTASTNQVSSTLVSLGNDSEFEFAFNEPRFSDRTLKIVIEPSVWGDDSQIGNSVVTKEFHISSAILSAKSPFFYKLFSNGMLETNQKHVSLRIDKSEEFALTEMIKFMYSRNLLTATEIPDLLDVLVVADKFCVSSCVRHCSDKLLTYPVTLENALIYLRLPYKLLMAESVQPLIDVVATHYKMDKSDDLKEYYMNPKVPTNIDISFAFNNPCFSDRTLVMESLTLGEDSEDSEIVIVTTKELYIASAILAAKSPFFYKLFSNGTLESTQKRVTLTIDPSEEFGVTEMIKFLYSTNLLEATEIPEWLDVLSAADKFSVSSCVTHCINKLLTYPVTVENALIYLRLPWNILMEESVQPLVEAAKEVVATHYKDVTDHPQDEIMALPLLAIEAICSSDEFLMPNEDYVYLFLVAWTEENYVDPTERQEVFTGYLARCIRFAWMTPRRLEEEVLFSDYLKTEISLNLVLQALIFQTASRGRKHTLASRDHRFVERKSYKYKPVKIVEFHEPHDQKIVYMDLKRTECAQLYPSHRRYSQGFSLAEVANLNFSEKLEYAFSVRTKTAGDFLEIHRGTTMTAKGDAVGCMDLLSMGWTEMIAEDSEFFIGDVLYLRVDMSIRFEDA